VTNEKNDLSKVIRDIQGGDKDAFHSLYSSWKNHAYHTAFVWTGDRTCAEDVMQETFVAVYKNINNLEHTEAFLSWFNQILARIAWRHNEKKNKAYALLIDSESAEFGTEFNDMRETSSDFLPEEYLENGEIRKAIMNGINGLPEAQKAAIVAFYLQHIPIATIAEMRKVSEGAIKNALHNGRRKLREMLEVSLGKGVLPAAFPIALVYDSINEIWSREMANSPVSAELSDLVFGSVLEDLGILGAEVSAEAVKTGSLLARIGSAACTLPVQIAGGLILVASVLGFTWNFTGETRWGGRLGAKVASMCNRLAGYRGCNKID